MSELNFNVMKQSAEVLGLVVSTDVTIEVLVGMLEKQFADNFSTDDLFACFKCQKLSDESFTICPFCGAVFDTVIAGNKYLRLADKVSLLVVEIVDDIAKCDVNGTIVDILTVDLMDIQRYSPIADGEVEQERPTAPKSMPKPPKPTPKVKDEVKKAVSPKVKDEVKKAVSPKPAPKVKEEVKKVEPTVALIPISEIVEIEDTVPEDLTEIPLEKIESFLKYRRSQAASDIFDLGRLMQSIFDRELYKDAGYRSWDQYIIDRWGISKQTAYNWMGIAKEFTREKARSLGVGKAVLLLQAPPEERKQLEEKVKKGTLREARQEVKKVKKEKGISDTRNKKERTPHSVSLADLLGKTFDLPWDSDEEGRWIDIPLMAGVFVRIFPTDTGLKGEIVQIQPEKK